MRCGVTGGQEGAKMAGDLEAEQGGKLSGDCLVRA